MAMRIGYFVYEFPPRMVGGLGTYAFEINKQFIKMGHEIEVFTMNDEDKLKTYEESKGLCVHRPIACDASDALLTFVDDELRRWGPGMKFFSDVMTYNFLSANKFVNEVAKKKNFDMIAAHDWLSALAGGISRTNLNIPFVFHMHSSEAGRMGGGGSQTVKDLEYFGAHKADRMITVSYSMREELFRLNFPHEKIRVSWNGVDEEKYCMRNFTPEELMEFKKKYGIKEDEKVIVFTGRLTWVKGIDALIRAMPMINSQVKTKLIVLGRGEMLDEMKSIAGNLGVGDRVIFVSKWVEERERILLYAISDVVGAPSRYEPQGIVPLEGMALEKPVLGGAGGIRESVVDEKTGLHINPDSPENIAQAAIKILKDDNLAKEMGRNGRKRILEEFTWEKIARDTLKIYKEAK